MTYSLNSFAKKVLQAIPYDPIHLEEVLSPSVLAPISQAPMMQAFVKRLNQARDNREKVLVAGDYDCDGMMATAIFVQGLQAFGLSPGFYIPNRLKEGYGLSAQTVQMAADKGYSLIITCDNGVRASEALAKAKELGIEVIVTDHHLMPDHIEADIIVHPNTLEEPFYSLCGAGIALECIRALHQEVDRFYIWAAIASIADCMEVFGQTRAIIQKGLALFNEQGDPHLDPFVRAKPISERDAAFQIAPKINAVGRLADRASANTFVQYLTTQDPKQIAHYAQQVCDLNQVRQQLTEQVYGKAQLFIKPIQPILMANDPSFHEGIIGLAAGHLTTQCAKPAIVCTLSDQGYKCSMRAPKGFHCLEFLSDFSGYSALGGHAQAAGFSVPSENWKAFETFIQKQGHAYSWQPQFSLPLDIEVDDLTVENIHALDSLRPFGTGFELPLFRLQDVEIVNIYDLSQGAHRKFFLKGGLQALHFNQSSTQAAMDPKTIRAFIGRPSINTFRGKEQVDFLIEEIQYA